MENAKTEMLDRLFGALTGVRPYNIGEYKRLSQETLSVIADAFCIAAADYKISPPSDAPIALDIETRGCVFEGSGERTEEPAVFGWGFALSGKIEFFVYPKTGTTAVYENKRALTGVFQVFYHFLSSILFDSLYEKLVTCDLQTGIPNLPSFLRFCGELLARKRADNYTAFMFNIRNFKSIHNSLSYAEGDAVMRRYCELVTNAISERELAAHLGGDNFVAVILNDDKDYFLDLIGNMVVKYPKGGDVLTFSFGATVGALELSESENVGDIMMHLGAAYHAARENRSLLCYYDKNAELGILEQKTILSKFYQAVAAREFKVVYQPKVGVKDRKLCGAEALVRWVRPDGGVVMPGSFIPVLEKDGCICTLDFYVLEEVCKFQKRLIAEGIEPVKISVNFSKRHLSNNKLVEEIVEMVDMHKVPHEFIEVELTESEDFKNNGVMKDVVDELCMQGIKTSIDDFGTGYSSFGMLRTLQLDTLKIDRSFIPREENADDEKSLLMLRGVVNLAKSLGLTTVAEGVETPDQLEIIEDLDCDIVQGYIFDKPLSEEDFLKRLLDRVYTAEK